MKVFFSYSKTKNIDNELVKSIITESKTVVNDLEMIIIDPLEDTSNIPISQKVLDGLKQADLLIAEITCFIPNVMYEVGFMKASGKPVIFLNNPKLQKDAEDEQIRQYFSFINQKPGFLPSDIGDVEYLQYEKNSSYDYSIFKNRLNNLIKK